MLRFTCCWHQQLLLSIEHSVAASELATFRQLHWQLPIGRKIGKLLANVTFIMQR